jgi:hypothetical protein
MRNESAQLMWSEKMPSMLWWYVHILLQFANHVPIFVRRMNELASFTTRSVVTSDNWAFLFVFVVSLEPKRVFFATYIETKFQVWLIQGLLWKKCTKVPDFEGLCFFIYFIYFYFFRWWKFQYLDK